jgi:hypothetical protein
MTTLNASELDCLKSIANEQPNTTPPCAEHILQRLVSLGLIEQTTNNWLPLEMMRVTYRLTTAGSTYLSQN